MSNGVNLHTNRYYECQNLKSSNYYYLVEKREDGMVCLFKSFKIFVNLWSKLYASFFKTVQ